MAITNLLIANRGEIAIRVSRAASELGIRTIAIYAEDDANSLHIRKTDEALPLNGKGVAAYLDGDQIIALAREAGCDAIHPGYGFLSENSQFAESCEIANISFVGPRPQTLALFGDKTKARELADKLDVPILAGTSKPTSLEEAESFLATLGDEGAIVIKALAGGGGRGMRVVESLDELAAAYERCQSEALQSFGNGDVYIEQLIRRARHIEVQVIGDGTGEVVHVGERECSLQRRHQKIVEIAPCPDLPHGLRDNLTRAACQMAEAVNYSSLGTVEFLVDGTDLSDNSTFAFIEANARLQVEHTVTEEVFGIDLVKTQLQLAAGATLSDLDLQQGNILASRGFAIQTRVNMETMQKDGTVRPTGGTLSAFDIPSGPGIRVDTFGYAGYQTNPNYDSLLAKLIVHSPSSDFDEVINRAYRALCEFKIEGLATNIPFLQTLLRDPSFKRGQVYTRFVDDNVAQLVAGCASHQQLFFDGKSPPQAPNKSTQAGATIDNSDPLAVLDHGKNGNGQAAGPEPVHYAETIAGPDNTHPVAAPIQGTIVSVDIAEGDQVRAGTQILVMEAMKMEHVITADRSGIVRALGVAAGDTIFEGHALAFIEESDVEVTEDAAVAEMDLDASRPDLDEVNARHAYGFDENRPEAVARRRKTGQRTVRENIDDLCDPGSFVEYGPLVIAAQRRRRSVQDLMEKTPADGLVAGMARVNGDLFEDTAAQVIAMSYDYTVLAGTQGSKNHAKKDRMFELAEKWRLPIVFFTEGGGGRPGDTDAPGVAGLDCWAFAFYGQLSGLVPLIGINSGRCFAGNAALLGCCDVVIATENSTIGMGGPAMIEGGNLGVFRPEEVGPMDVQVANGVVDIPVRDEEEAVSVAKKYLSYFQGALDDWSCEDQRRLRHIIPENRLRIYDVREVIETLADTGSVLELRKGFGPGMVTSFARIEGRAVGIIANNPTHLAGAIDSNGADKAARFMQLCDAFDIPILFLCDTPGIMVGPEAEKTALVRHASRMFVTGASLTVPFFTVILRKGYGLGAQAMAGGSFKAPFFTIAWPTSEFGGMGLEGAVKLGYRKELAAIEDPEERKTAFEDMVARAYEHGKGTNMASHFEIDDVVDPFDTRTWILSALKSVPQPEKRREKKRPCIDTW